MLSHHIFLGYAFNIAWKTRRVKFLLLYFIRTDFGIEKSLVLLQLCFYELNHNFYKVVAHNETITTPS